MKYLSIKQCFIGDRQLSSIGFGMGAGIEPNLYLESDVSNRLKSAINNGINWFDAAESYHGGYAEEILGKTLGKIKEVYFFTKFSPINGSSKNLRQALEGSLRRLKRECIDIYQMHWPLMKVEDYREIFGLLDDFKREGKIRGVGLCNFDLQNYSELSEDEISHICSSQFEFSLFNSENYMNLSSLHKNKEILSIAYGVFEGVKRGMDSDGSFGILRDLSDKYSITQSQVVMNWAYSKNLALLTSSRSVARTLENIRALEIIMTKKDLEAIDFFFPGRSCNMRIVDIDFDQNLTNYYCYANLDEALENKLDLSPSPKDLAATLRFGGKFKPIKLLKRSSKSGVNYYYLLNGMVRYWAWRIAYPGRDLVPSYIVG